MVETKTVPTTRKCSACKVIKSLHNFYPHKGNFLNRDYRCKPCNKLNRRKWYQKNREKALAKMREYNTVHKEQRRAYLIQSKYHLSPQQFAELYSKQNGACAVCSSTLSLSIDHNHLTGKVRGLLCDKCNMGIGLFGDDANLLAKAMAYLEKT